MRGFQAAVAVAVLWASGASAANLPAGDCQLFIRKLKASPSSHGSGAIPVIVRTAFLGDGEMVRRVGFWGRTVANDLGNAPDCHFGPSYPTADWRVIEPMPVGAGGTEFGEYYFNFAVRSGSVVSGCPGYYYDWIGSFFLETDRNTYWLNPDLSASQSFVFDNHAMRLLEERGGLSSWLSTAERGDLRYYNPLICR